MLDKGIVGTAPSHELCVRATLGDRATLQHNRLVRVANGAEPVRCAGGTAHPGEDSPVCHGGLATPNGWPSANAGGRGEAIGHDTHSAYQ